MKWCASALQVTGCMIALSPYQALSEAWWTTLAGVALSWVAIIWANILDRLEER